MQSFHNSLEVFFSNVDHILMPYPKVQDFFCFFAEIQLVIHHIVEIYKFDSFFSEST